MKTTIITAFLCALSFSAQAQMVVELSASASVAAPNDMVKVVVFMEENGASPAQLARIINPKLSEVVQLAKSKKNIRTKTGFQRTYPIYEKNRLRMWRMRAEVELESEDLPAMSELVGELQAQNFGVEHIQQMPSRSTRRKIESESTRLAIQDFQTRAKEIADVFKKPYKIKQLNVNREQGSGIYFRSNAPMMAKYAADSVGSTIEAGESQITTHIQGSIEIAQ